MNFRFGSFAVLPFLKPRPERLLRQFRERFSGRSLIIHAGFEENWLKELLKQPGGGGHFRLDTRPMPCPRPTPIEWFVQEHVLPLSLPSPLFCRVDADQVLLRHLRRGTHVVHPSEIAWFAEELETRHHFRLELTDHPEEIRRYSGISVSDNECPGMLEQLLG